MNVLAPVWTIAHNTVREAVRHRVLYTFVFFAVGLIALGVLLSTLTYVERERIIQNVGLAAIRLFAVLIAIFIGVNLLHKEVDRRTIYTILSKPVSRTQFLLGKFFGLVATIWLQMGIMSMAFAAVLWLTDAPLGAAHAAAVGLVAFEVVLIVALATLFSAFTTPLLSSLFALGLYVVGHLSRDLLQLGVQSGVASIERATAVLYALLPDLEAFNLTIQAVHGLPVGPEEVWLPIGYAILYSAAVLALASFVFARRDFR